jgi:diguanylate cyclase (GGDEF)-like protein
MGERGFRILAIDDTRDVREVLQACLTVEGYLFLAAADGPEGLTLARETQPDLILLDLLMPEMDGFEVCRRLKDAPDIRRIPVIFLTARSQVADRVQGLSLGAVDFVAKPFDLRELVARVEAALRTKQALEALERANDELQTASVTDPLTGLYNRRHFEARLAEELKNGDRRGVPAACFLLDVDHLKEVNDVYGHLAGDAMLREFAGVIRQRTRKGDVAARLGGDEFALLLIGVTPATAQAAAERVRSAVEAAEFRFQGAPIPMTASVGASFFPLGERTRPEAVLEQADRALYQAKQTRNRVQVAASIVPS